MGFELSIPVNFENKCALLFSVVFVPAVVTVAVAAAAPTAMYFGIALQLLTFFATSSVGTPAPQGTPASSAPPAQSTVCGDIVNSCSMYFLPHCTS